MKSPKIYADYMKLDNLGRLILVCFGTHKDLEKNKINLKIGLELTFYMDSDFDEFGNPDDLLVDGIVDFDQDNQRWVAKIDQNTFRQESDIKKSLKLC